MVMLLIWVRWLISSLSLELIFVSISWGFLFSSKPFFLLVFTCLLLIDSFCFGYVCSYDYSGYGRSTGKVSYYPFFTLLFVFKYYEASTPTPDTTLSCRQVSVHVWHWQVSCGCLTRVMTLPCWQVLCGACVGHWHGIQHCLVDKGPVGVYVWHWHGYDIASLTSVCVTVRFWCLCMIDSILFKCDSRLSSTRITTSRLYLNCWRVDMDLSKKIWFCMVNRLEVDRRYIWLPSYRNWEVLYFTVLFFQD